MTLCSHVELFLFCLQDQCMEFSYLLASTSHLLAAFLDLKKKRICTSTDARLFRFGLRIASPRSLSPPGNP